MRSGSTLLVAFLGVSLTRAALTLEKKDVPSTLEVPFGFGPMFGSNSMSRVGIDKRKNVLDVDAAIENMVFVHTNITVGTPPQEMEVYFNIMGNECWIHAANSTSCQWFKDKENCDGYGGYNTSTSKTAEFVSSDFAVNDRGPNVTGDFFKDALVIGNTKLDSMKLGVAYDGITSNTIGLGYGEEGSSSVSLPQALTDAGIINSPAFSMWTNYGYRYGGKILFGGVNKAKYSGTLQTLPIVPGPSGERKAFRVNMTGLLINETSISPESFTLDALLDNQVSLTHVPESVMSALAIQLNVEKIPESGQITLPCSLETSKTNITLEFGAAKFEFPIGLLMTQVSVEHAYTRYGDACYSGIVANRDYNKRGSIVLGTNFIRSVYSVFDLANDEVSLANLVSESYSDNIVEITSGENSVPGATATTTDKGQDKDQKDGEESLGSTLENARLCFGLTIAVLCYILI
ncbi:acid protease [Aspergillus affinis]|uniref:acid protease n=1 Tax=Aspergillus affinis TaxID=1070780 RepID=UPI0022FEC32C|nr:acid protease [Aspergillus affinis]KAI9035252.1 acid protease [Aspergillus affinis]